MADEQTMPSVLTLNWSNVKEFEILEEDSEVELVVKKAEFHRSEKGNYSLHLVTEVPDMPMVDDIHTYLGIPPVELETEDTKAYNKRMSKLGEAYDAFGVERTESADPSAFVGRRAWAIIGIEAGNGRFSDRNWVKRWVGKAS